MIQLLVKCSNWKFILPFFLLTAFLIYQFNQGQSEISAIVGEEVTLIDLWQTYDLDRISTFFESLKDEGRALHQRLTGIEDMIFPFAYGPLLMLILAFFLKNIFGKESLWILLALFPVLTMGLDYLENFNTLHMLSAFPDLTDSIVEKGARYTELKHLTTNISVVMVILSGIAWLFITARQYMAKRKGS